MRIGAVFILMFSFHGSFCQDSAWQRFRIDSNLTIDFKGPVDKGLPMTIDQYSYEGYSARTGLGVYVVMIGTSKQKIEVFNREDYRKTLDNLVAGAMKAASEQDWKTSVSDVIIDRVPGKLMSYNGYYSGFNAQGKNYLFLVNGLSYTISAVFLHPLLSRQDSADLDHFVSSIRFTSNVHEMQFATKAEYVGYSFGRLIGMLVVLAIMIVVVVVVVRILVGG